MSLIPNFSSSLNHKYTYMICYVSEPILESAMEVFILLTLWGQQPELISGSNDLFETDTLFIATFISSLISASMGIASFLQTGPSRLVPKKGFYGGFGYILLTINIACTMALKSLLNLHLSDIGKGNETTTTPTPTTTLSWSFDENDSDIMVRSQYQNRKMYRKNSCNI